MGSYESGIRRKLRSSDSNDEPNVKKFLTEEKCLEVYSSDLDAINYEDFKIFNRLLDVDVEIHDNYDRPTYKLTNFILYEKNEQICTFDDVDDPKREVFLSGEVKFIVEECAPTEKSFKIKNIKVKSVWICGYGEGELATICLTSSNDFDYYLTDVPFLTFEKIFFEYSKKAFMTKKIIELLLIVSETHSASYDEIIERLKEFSVSEEYVEQNAQFITKHIYSFDAGSDDDETDRLTDNDFFKTLESFFDQQLEELENVESNSKRAFRNAKSSKIAFVTPIIMKSFENLNSFQNKMKQFCMDDDDIQIIKTKKVNCGKCLHCARNLNCLSPSFVEIDEVDEVTSTAYGDFDDDPIDISKLIKDDRKQFLVRRSKNFWSVDTGSLFLNEQKEECFTELSSASKSLKVSRFDFVSFIVSTNDKTLKNYFLIGRINYFYIEDDVVLAHVSWLAHASDTILVGLANDRQHYFFGRCENVDVRCIVRKENIEYSPARANFYEAGGKNDSHCFPNGPFVRMWYDARKPKFYYPDSLNIKPISCPDCPFFFCNKDEVGRSFMSVERLKTMDLCAGAGGLSEGLRQSEVADIKYAVEINADAAESFRTNHKDATVFKMDINDFLENVLKDRREIDRRRLPLPGEVDMIVGGPPCQGFSGLNRHKSSENSLSKNLCIPLFFSVVDKLRPKFVLMETVPLFMKHERGEALKSVIRALTRIGYQCTFFVLQAGSYGVPQSRRRLIILGAAPDQFLPESPPATHSFLQKHLLKHLLPAVTVHDALDGLPVIDENDDNKETSKGYPIEAVLGSYDHWMRNDGDRVIDHVSRKLSPLDLKRVRLIPCLPYGSDWQALLNIVGKTIAYEEIDEKGNLKYFECDTDVECHCRKKLMKTIMKIKNLIPRYLVHSFRCQKIKNRGVFGRVDPEGFFDTLTTSAQPSAKQGRVIHPTDHRTLSVREYARGQSFFDTYQFCGENISSKYRQIGNAVPPLLARAIGKEIYKAISKKNVF